MNNFSRQISVSEALRSLLLVNCSVPVHSERRVHFDSELLVEVALGAESESSLAPTLPDVAPEASHEALLEGALIVEAPRLLVILELAILLLGVLAQRKDHVLLQQKSDFLLVPSVGLQESRRDFVVLY